MNGRLLGGPSGLGWPGIVRLGLVQAALGAIVVLTTSTLNRVMIVEYALPAVLPGLLVALHYAVQMVRPRFGHGSDVGGNRTRWIVGGMVVLALGSTLAAVATALLGTDRPLGLTLAVVAYALIGLGVGAAGTSLLVLMAQKVAPARRAPAATTMWIMMIFGFAVSSALAGRFLDPFTPARLVEVSAVTSTIALAIALLAIRGIERRPSAAAPAPRVPDTDFRAALRDVWSDATARRFTLFVFASMLAYAAQDLIMEPFAGLVFGMTPGESTQLSGLQHGATMLGMIAVALFAGPRGGTRGGARTRGLPRVGPLRAWIIGGCTVSALALFALAIVGPSGSLGALRASIFVLGVSNGAFAVAAIGSMMELAGRNRDGRDGMRMGLWGAAQAIAFALGGLIGAAAVDVARDLVGAPVAAYGLVFGLEGMLFLVSARMAATLNAPASRREGARVGPASELALASTPERSS
jgi:BCD family chlorophyll transporter-like MFS transporter